MYVPVCVVCLYFSVMFLPASGLQLSDLSKSNDTSRTCDDIQETMKGHWDMFEGRPVWIPFGCKLHIYNPAEIHQCLSEKRVALFGDSLLLNIFSPIAQRL